MTSRWTSSRTTGGTSGSTSGSSAVLHLTTQKLKVISSLFELDINVSQAPKPVSGVKPIDVFI